MMARIAVEEARRIRPQEIIAEAEAEQALVEGAHLLDVLAVQHHVPHAERPGAETRDVAARHERRRWRSPAPWNSSMRVPAGSCSTIRSFTCRSSASAREPRATFTPAASSLPASASIAARVSDLPAEIADALPAIRVDDDALLAVVHAERHRGAGLVDALQTEEIGAELLPVAQFLGAKSDISQCLHAHAQASSAFHPCIVSRHAVSRKTGSRLLQYQISPVARAPRFAASPHFAVSPAR